MPQMGGKSGAVNGVVMQKPAISFYGMSEGQNVRFLAYLIVAVSSGMLGLFAILQMEQETLFAQRTWYQTWVVAASAIGGATALFLGQGRLGGAGLRGMISGLAGGLWVTFVGAVIGGTLALPLYGTMFGPFIVTVTFLGMPVLAVQWGCVVLAVHVLLGGYQRERQAAFDCNLTTHEDEPADSTARFMARLT